MAAQNAPFVFSLSLPGQEPLVAALQRFASEIPDWREFWADWFRDAWYRAIDTNYVTQGRSSGEGWPPLSESYGAWKQKHWPGIPIGVRSGALRESLTFPNDSNAVWRAEATTLEVGTAVPYGLFMQLGTQRSGRAAGLRPHKTYTYGSGGGMPPRPPLRVGADFLLLMGQLLQEYSVKKLRDQLG